MSSISGIPDTLSWYKCSNILNLYTKMCKIKFRTVKCLDTNFFSTILLTRLKWLSLNQKISALTNFVKGTKILKKKSKII